MEHAYKLITIYRLYKFFVQVCKTRCEIIWKWWINTFVFLSNTFFLAIPNTSFSAVLLLFRPVNAIQFQKLIPIQTMLCKGKKKKPSLVNRIHNKVDVNDSNQMIKFRYTYYTPPPFLCVGKLLKFQV